MRGMTRTSEKNMIFKAVYDHEGFDPEAMADRYLDEVAPVDKLSLILVAIFAAVFLGERPNLRELFGIALVGIGVVVLGFKR